MIRYLSFLLLIFIVGCQSTKTNNVSTRFHDDGRAKPVVTIVPVLDSTCYDIPWSLSEELSSLINQKINRQNNIYISKNEGEFFLSSHDNPFGNNIEWTKKSFKSNEFVVFLELLEHDDIPLLKTTKNPKKLPEARKSASNLNMSIRLRIIDIRGDAPKIVLQEMIQDTFYMANNIDKTDYNTVTWGTNEYVTSPMGIAHTQFVKQVIERITDYIMLAKSR